MARRRKKQLSILEVLIGPCIFSSFFLILLATKSVIAGFISFFIVGALFISIRVHQNIRYNQKLKQSGISDIDKMDGRQFEHYLGILFKEQGYSVEVTQAAGDFGADLVIEKAGKKIVVQAKRYSKNVGIEAVQQVQGSIKHYRAQEGWVISNQDYTEAAISLAKSNEIRLINRQELIEMSLKLNFGQSTATIPKQLLAQLPQMSKECDRCGGQMVRRKGPKGEFFGCIGFPNCRNTKAIT